MKHIQSFENFLNESDNLSPAAKMQKALAGAAEKINDLKKQLTEKPEQRDFIIAKIKVEEEKLDVIQASGMLIAAKEKEDRRKEMEKQQKEKEKASKAASKQ